MKEIAIALYTINKEAKRIRDEREELKRYLFEGEINKFTIYSDSDEIFDEDINNKYMDEDYYYREFELDEEDEEDSAWVAHEVECAEKKQEKYDALHASLKNMMYEKNRLYSYKKDVMDKLNLNPVEHHVFPEGVRPLYKLEGFKFHGEVDEMEHEDDHDIFISEEKSSENKLDEEEKMPVEEALNILNNFLNNQEAI